MELRVRSMYFIVYNCEYSVDQVLLPVPLRIYRHKLNSRRQWPTHQIEICYWRRTSLHDGGLDKVNLLQTRVGNIHDMEK